MASLGERPAAGSDQRPAKRLKLSTTTDNFTISPESNSTAASSVSINPANSIDVPSMVNNGSTNSACANNVANNPAGPSVARSEGESTTTTDVPISPAEAQQQQLNMHAATEVHKTLQGETGFASVPTNESFNSLVNTASNNQPIPGGNLDPNWDAMEIARNIPSPTTMEVIQNNERLLIASKNRDKLLSGCQFEEVMDPNNYSCTVLIEQQHVGQLMGAQGSGLQKIKSSCECPWLAIDQDTRETGYSIVNIQEDNKKPAVIQVLSLLRGFFEDTRMKDALKMGASKEIRIDQQFIGGIIGRSGAAIEELKKDIGIEIVVDQSTKFEGYSRLTIYGQPAKIRIANDELERRVGEMRDAARMRAEGKKGKGKGNMGTDSWGMKSMGSSGSLGGGRSMPVEMTGTGKGKGGMYVSDKPIGCKSIVIKNVPYAASEDDLKRHFAHCGPVANVHKLTRDGRFIGIVFVEFFDSTATDEAIKMNQSIYMGRQLCLDYATGQQERRGGTNRLIGGFSDMGGKGNDSMSNWSGSSNTNGFSSYGMNSSSSNGYGNNNNGQDNAANALAALLGGNGNSNQQQNNSNPFASLMGGNNNGNNNNNNGNMNNLLNQLVHTNSGPNNQNNNNNNNNNALAALLGGGNSQPQQQQGGDVTNQLIAGLLGNGNNNSAPPAPPAQNDSFDAQLQALLGTGNNGNQANGNMNQKFDNFGAQNNANNGNNNGNNGQYSDQDWNSWLNSVI